MVSSTQLNFRASIVKNLKQYIPLATVGLMGLLLLLSMWQVPWISGGEVFIPRPSQSELVAVTSRIEMLMLGSDQIVSMLTAVSFGLFVLVGAPLQIAVNSARTLKLDEIISASGFAVCVFVSIYFGLVARVQAFELANFGHDDFLPLLNIFGWQAAFLAVSAMCSFYFAISSLTRTIGERKR